MFSLGRNLLGLPDDTSNNAKLEFKQAVDSRFVDQTISPNDALWTLFWIVFDDASDVHSLLPESTLRQALVKKHENVRTLVLKVSEHIFELLDVTCDVFPPQFTNVDQASPFSLSSLSRTLSTVTTTSSSVPQRDTVREMLNCMRVLTHVIPILFETMAHTQNETQGRATDSAWISKLFWDTYLSPNEQFVIDDEDYSFESHQAESCLGHRLLSAVTDLLFVPNFSLPGQVGVQGPSKTHHVIWQPGVGSSLRIEYEPSHDNARLETLRFLLALLSSSIYLPNHTNIFLNCLLSLKDRKTALTLLCSLMNTALVQPSEGSLFSPSEALQKLGAMSYLSNQAQYKQAGQELPLLSFQILNILLVSHDAPLPGAGTYSTPVSPIKERYPNLASSSRRPSLAPSLSTDFFSENVFRMYLSKIHRQVDYGFLWNDIWSSITFTPPSSPLNLLSGKPTSHTSRLTATIVFLWRLAECNKGFVSYLIDQDKSALLLVILLTVCLEHKDDVAAFGLVRLVAFTLQSLTAAKGFGSRLNVNLSSLLATHAALGQGLGASVKKWSSVKNGNVMDYLITSVHSLVFSTPSHFNAVYSSFILCIFNCSPYIKGLSVLASTKLLQLFLAFSAPAFLLAEEGNPRLVYYLVETFNNVIHYQLSDNPHLVYAIIQSHRRFEALANFSLKGAVDDIRRVRAERRLSTTRDDTASNGDGLSEQANFAKSNSSSISLASLNLKEEEKNFGVVSEEEDPVRMSEKARGKMRERSASFESVARGEDYDPGHPGPYRSKSGFTPTESWIDSWRNHMPLDSILILLAELQPKVSSLCSVASKSTNQAAIDFIKSVTLLDVLPAAPPLKTRAFQHSANSIRWLSSLVWSLAYVDNLKVFGTTRVALFSVQQSNQPSVVTEATQAITRVGSAMLQRMPSSTSSPRRSFSVVV